MFSRSKPWRKADKKKVDSDGNSNNLNPTSPTVPLHMYEKLQLQLMGKIDTLADRDAEVSSLSSQVKTQTANAKLFAFKIETLEQSVKQKDREIAALKNQLSTLRASAIGDTTQQQPREQAKKEKKLRSKRDLQDKKSKRNSNKSKSNPSSCTSSGVKKSAGKKKKTRKRITLHNHELSKAAEDCVETIRDSNKDGVAETSSTRQNKGSTDGSLGSTDEGSSELLVINDNINPLRMSGHSNKTPLKMSMHSEDDTMCSQANCTPIQSRRQTLPPRFWNNFWPSPDIVSPLGDDRPVLDPTKMEMADDVSDLSRSYRSEFSISIWSPSPVVKRRELVLSDTDKAAMGICSVGPIVDKNIKQMRRSSLNRSRSKQQMVDEQPLNDSPGMSLWQVDEIATVEEEATIEEEINGDTNDGEITDDGDGILTSSISEDILEDDSIASSSMSC